MVSPVSLYLTENILTSICHAIKYHIWTLIPVFCPDNFLLFVLNLKRPLPSFCRIIHRTYPNQVSTLIPVTKMPCLIHHVVTVQWGIFHLFPLVFWNFFFRWLLPFIYFSGLFLTVNAHYKIMGNYMQSSEMKHHVRLLLHLSWKWLFNYQTKWQQ